MGEACLLDGGAEGEGLLTADAEEEVTVRAGAGAATASLDPEEVVEETGGEMAVEVLAAGGMIACAAGEDDEGEDGLAVARLVPEDVEAGVRRQPRHGASPQRRLPVADERMAGEGLDGEGEGGAELLHYWWRARVLSLLQILAVERLLRRKTRTRSAAVR